MARPLSDIEEEYEYPLDKYLAEHPRITKDWKTGIKPSSTVIQVVEDGFLQHVQELVSEAEKELDNFQKKFNLDMKSKAQEGPGACLAATGPQSNMPKFAAVLDSLQSSSSRLEEDVQRAKVYASNVVQTAQEMAFDYRGAHLISDTDSRVFEMRNKVHDEGIRKQVSQLSVSEANTAVTTSIEKEVSDVSLMAKNYKPPYPSPRRQIKGGHKKSGMYGSQKTNVNTTTSAANRKETLKSALAKARQSVEEAYETAQEVSSILDKKRFQLEKNRKCICSKKQPVCDSTHHTKECPYVNKTLKRNLQLSRHQSKINMCSCCHQAGQDVRSEYSDVYTCKEGSNVMERTSAKSTWGKSNTTICSVPRKQYTPGCCKAKLIDVKTKQWLTSKEETEHKNLPLANLIIQELPSVNIRRELAIQKVPSFNLPKPPSEEIPYTPRNNIGLIDYSYSASQVEQHSPWINGNKYYPHKHVTPSFRPHCPRHPQKDKHNTYSGHRHASCTCHTHTGNDKVHKSSDDCKTSNRMVRFAGVKNNNYLFDLDHGQSMCLKADPSDSALHTSSTLADIHDVVDSDLQQKQLNSVDILSYTPPKYPCNSVINAASPQKKKTVIQSRTSRKVSGEQKHPSSLQKPSQNMNLSQHKTKTDSSYIKCKGCSSKKQEPDSNTVRRPTLKVNEQDLSKKSVHSKSETSQQMNQNNYVPHIISLKQPLRESKYQIIKRSSQRTRDSTQQPLLGQKSLSVSHESQDAAVIVEDHTSSNDSIKQVESVEQKNIFQDSSLGGESDIGNNPNQSEVEPEFSSGYHASMLDYRQRNDNTVLDSDIRNDDYVHNETPGDHSNEDILSLIKSNIPKVSKKMAMHQAVSRKAALGSSVPPSYSHFVLTKNEQRITDLETTGSTHKEHIYLPETSVNQDLVEQILKSTSLEDKFNNLISIDVEHENSEVGDVDSSSHETSGIQTLQQAIMNRVEDEIMKDIIEQVKSKESLIEHKESSNNSLPPLDCGEEEGPDEYEEDWESDAGDRPPTRSSFALDENDQQPSSPDILRKLSVKKTTSPTKEESIYTPVSSPESRASAIRSVSSYRNKSGSSTLESPVRNISPGVRTHSSSPEKSLTDTPVKTIMSSPHVLEVHTPPRTPSLSPKKISTSRMAPVLTPPGSPVSNSSLVSVVNETPVLSPDSSDSEEPSRCPLPVPTPHSSPTSSIELKTPSYDVFPKKLSEHHEELVSTVTGGHLSTDSNSESLISLDHDNTLSEGEIHPKFVQYVPLRKPPVYLGSSLGEVPPEGFSVGELRAYKNMSMGEVSSQIQQHRSCSYGQVMPQSSSTKVSLDVLYTCPTTTQSSEAQGESSEESQVSERRKDNAEEEQHSTGQVISDHSGPSNLRKHNSIYTSNSLAGQDGDEVLYSSNSLFDQEVLITAPGSSSGGTNISIGEVRDDEDSSM